MAGRNTKLTPTVQRKIVKVLKTGATIADACRHAGIHPDTYYEWLKRGEAGEPPFSDFSDAATRALVDAKVTAIGTLRSAMSPYRETSTTTETFTETKLNRKGEPYDYKRETKRETVSLYAGDWRAAVEYLKRRAPDEWSEKHILELNLPPDLLKRFVDAANAAGVSAGDALEAFVQELASADSSPGGSPTSDVEAANTPE